MSRHVSVSTARELDHAMVLLNEGKISYGRWVEVLRAWVSGEDVSRFDFGDAESLPERIARLYEGRSVTARLLAGELGAPARSASQALRRLCRARRARRLGHGEYLVGRQVKP